MGQLKKSSMCYERYLGFNIDLGRLSKLESLLNLPTILNFIVLLIVPSGKIERKPSFFDFNTICAHNDNH